MQRTIHLIASGTWTVLSLFSSGESTEAAAQSASAPGSAAFSATATVSPAAQVLSLEHAVQLALENNPELRAAQARIDAATGRASQARLWQNPELELSTEEGPVRGGRAISDAKQTIGLTQTLPFPGKKGLDRRMSWAEAQSSQAALDERRLEIVRDVKTAFYGVLTAERLVAVARELVELAESSAAAARKRVEAGAAADQEQLRTEILLEQARAELADFESDLTADRETLATVLGAPLQGATLSGELKESADPALLEGGRGTWLPAHPRIIAARINRDRGELGVRRAALEPYPDVTVGVAGGREGVPDRHSIVEFRVSVPVPIIDRSKGRQQEALANLALAQAEQAAVEQRLLRDWNVASTRWRTAAAQVTAYRERILPKASDALRLVQTGFDEGKFGFIDLLDTQRTVAEARLEYQRKLLELNVAQAELEALMGGMPGRPRKADSPSTLENR